MNAATGPTSDRSGTDRDESFGISVSLILHLLIATVIIVKSLIFPSKPIAYIPSLRVDLVGLPDILKKDLSQLSRSTPDMAEALKKAEEAAKEIDPPKVKNEVEPAAKDELVLKPKPQVQDVEDSKKRIKKNQSALDRIKALSKIAQLDEADKKAPVLIKGNQISKGTSLSGEARENSQSGYYDSLRERFQESWALPIWLERQKLSAQVHIWIDASGRLLRYAFVKSSGNPQFDEAVKRTLTASQPYPAPPPDIRAGLASGGILVGFPL